MEIIEILKGITTLFKPIITKMLLTIVITAIILLLIYFIFKKFKIIK